MKLGPLVILVACVFAISQHASAQAVGETMQINKGSMQGVGNASGRAIQLNPFGTEQSVKGSSKVQVADPQRPLPDCGCAKQPVFSAPSGNAATGTQVTLTSPTPGAIIYYTTGGWTPTRESARYTGPIAIHADTKLQAIAEEPGKLPSPIASANYTVSGTPAPNPQSVTVAGGTLLKGTALRIVTGADIASDSAQVGDRIPLVLDENVVIGDKVVAPRGTPVEATITRVVPAGQNGRPGVLTFQVLSLDANGVHIPLTATLTLSAPDLAAQAETTVNTSMVHIARALPPGEEAEIQPGMLLIAYVAADIALHP